MLGSHRNAVLNMGAESAARLEVKLEIAQGLLGFDALPEQVQALTGST